MSVIVENSQPITNLPYVLDSWEQWDGMDIQIPIITSVKTLPALETSFAFMDTEEITVVQKRPRRSFHKEITKPSTQKKTKHVEIQVSGKILTLAEYQAECARKIEEIKQKQETDRLYAIAQRIVAEKAASIAALSPKSLRKHKKAESKKAKKEQKTETKKEEKSEWITVQKVEKPTSIIRAPDTILPSNSVVSKGTTLILKNLPKTIISNKELMKFFGKCGQIKFINILTNEDNICKGLAFVKFENKTGSEKGLKMNGFWYENNKVYVEYAKDKN